MHRCRFNGNKHRSGALIRVTDGFSLTSLRSSSFRCFLSMTRYTNTYWLHASCRCNFSGNVHRSGALIGITDGFFFTSLRSSSFCRSSHP